MSIREKEVQRSYLMLLKDLKCDKVCISFEREVVTAYFISFCSVQQGIRNVWEKEIWEATSERVTEKFWVHTPRYVIPTVFVQPH